MKNKSLNMLIVGLILLGIMAVMLTVLMDFAHDDFKENVKVNRNGATMETLTVRGLKLNPTEKKEYEVNLTCLASGGFDIFLDYEEKQNGGMKPFVNVTVKSDGNVVYEGTLTELLDTDKVIEFDGELKAKEPLVVTICYEMPYDVGNEAQGTSADFDIHLKIVKN